MKKIIIPLLLLSVIFTGCTNKENVVPQGCTEEAKVCPDGSAVGRTGPNCEFAPCPGEGTSNCSCPEGYIQQGQACNPSCYYSTPKCLAPSIQCK